MFFSFGLKNKNYLSTNYKSLIRSQDFLVLKCLQNKILQSTNRKYEVKVENVLMQ